MVSGVNIWPVQQLPPALATGRVTLRVVKGNEKGSSLLLSKHFIFIPTHGLCDSYSLSAIDSDVSSTLCVLYCASTLNSQKRKPNQNKTNNFQELSSSVKIMSEANTGFLTTKKRGVTFLAQQSLMFHYVLLVNVSVLPWVCGYWYVQSQRNKNHWSR